MEDSKSLIIFCSRIVGLWHVENLCFPLWPYPGAPKKYALCSKKINKHIVNKRQYVYLCIHQLRTLAHIHTFDWSMFEFRNSLSSLWQHRWVGTCMGCVRNWFEGTCCKSRIFNPVVAWGNWVLKWEFNLMECKSM